ncbi:MAG: PQQ-binding-like beta-propeller repeat protein, partial [Planctomycetota bacterium]
MNRSYHNPRLPLSILLLSLALLAVPTHAQEWTRFRGPNGNGVSGAKSIPSTWKKNDYSWICKLPGKGHSSPVVWGDNVFVTSAESASFLVICVSAAKGDIRWTRSIDYRGKKTHKNNSFASSTPCVDAQRVYVLLQTKKESPLLAYTHEGKLEWRIDLGAYNHGQGGATSPIVYEDLVVVSNDHGKGSFLAGYDRATGRERWKIPRLGRRACYSTPCVYRPQGGAPQLIFSHSFEGVSGHDPVNGRSLWMLDVFGRFSQRAIGSPFVSGEYVVTSSGARAGERNVVIVRPGSATSKSASEIFRVKKSAPHVPTPVAYKDWLFLWGDQGVVVCTDRKTG